MIIESEFVRDAARGKAPGSRRAELHLWYATLTVTIASGVMSTIGVYEVLAENRRYGLALSLLVGVVITALLSGAWRYLFHAYPRAEGTKLVYLSLLMSAFGLSADLRRWVGQRSRSDGRRTSATGHYV